MAKRRKVKPSKPVAGEESPHREETPDGAGSTTLQLDLKLPLMVAVAILGGICVYVSYHPSDSVAVENGDALWFGVIAILLATITWTVTLWQGQAPGASEQRKRASLIIDSVPWVLAGWMMLAAFATSPPGNLRMATSEAWLWISGAAVFTSARRLMQTRQTQAALVALLVVCALGLAIHGLHQQFISLPNDRFEFRQNPEKMLRDQGIDAPVGSAERMVFESRLLDGGPTGTFALANSLAGVLVVGIVVSLAVLRWSWSTSGWTARSSLSVCLLICLVCLVAVRSRSALLAVITASFLFFVWEAISRNADQRRAKLGIVIKGLIFAGAIVAVAVIAMASFGDAEWIDQAPSSVAFRLQYWRSTLAMTFDRPLFSAGPGNFQTIYLRYREDSASEQIAEPHNFIFETMASGGFLAFGLLLALLITMVWILSRQNQTDFDQTDFAKPEADDDQSNHWVWLGGGVSLAMVWLIGAAAGRTPDFPAHVFVVPVALLFAWLAWPAFQRLSQTQLVAVSLTALLALLIHLSASGGWTIPGVAIHVWLLAALLTRVCHLEIGSPQPGWGIAALVSGIVMLAVLRSMSLIPVQTVQIATASFEYSQKRGHSRRAMLALDSAIDADPWSATALLWRTDLLHWRIVREGESDRLRQRWESDQRETQKRGGESPSLWEALGHQQLHLFQRYGKEADLAAAQQTYEKVVAWNPADQRAVAQLAAILAARGDAEGAKNQAQRASYLSELGDNIERLLAYQLIYVPKHVGSAAMEKPIRVPASEMLSNQLR